MKNGLHGAPGKQKWIQSSALPLTSPEDFMMASQVISLFLFWEIRNTAFLCVEDYPSVMARHFSTLNLSSATSPLSRELVFKSTGRLCDPQTIMQQIRGLNPGTRSKSDTEQQSSSCTIFSPRVSSFILFWTVAGVNMGMPDSNTVDRKSPKLSEEQNPLPWEYDSSQIKLYFKGHLSKEFYLSILLFKSLKED